MILIYRILINVVIIISPVIIFLRILKKKEDPTRFKEKFCIISKKRKKGKIIWFHGASVGEILSIIPLLEKLERKKNISQILVTSSTLSSSKILSKFKLKKTIHQFFPIDSNFFVKRFLNYWMPSAAVFIESEIWPNMIINVKKKSIPLLLLNARITNKSYKRWNMIPSLSKLLFESFDISFPQNFETKEYLKSLGAKKIKVLGNLKFSENENEKRNKFNNKIKNFLNSKIIWCASSTHNTEETICSKAHKKLKKKYKNLLTIIIPRHIHRIEQIKNEIENLDLKIHNHSSQKKIDAHTDIYLVDTYGETKLFFKVCKTVFLGGSMIQHGGQNPLEAARYGCNILHGPYVKNFDEIYELLKKNNLSFKIKNINQLTKILNISLNKKSNSIQKIKKLKKIGTNVLNLTLNELSYYIKN